MLCQTNTGFSPNAFLSTYTPGSLHQPNVGRICHVKPENSSPWPDCVGEVNNYTPTSPSGYLNGFGGLKPFFLWLAIRGATAQEDRMALYKAVFPSL